MSASPTHNLNPVTVPRHQGPKWRRGFGVATQNAGSDIPVLRHRSELKLQGLNPKDGLSCDSYSVRGIYYPDTAQTERS